MIWKTPEALGAVVIRDTTALTMYPHIRKQVRTGSEIFTDRFSATWPAARSDGCTGNTYSVRLFDRSRSQEPYPACLTASPPRW